MENVQAINADGNNPQFGGTNDKVVLLSMVDKNLNVVRSFPVAITGTHGVLIDVAQNKQDFINSWNASQSLVESIGVLTDCIGDYTFALIVNAGVTPPNSLRVILPTLKLATNLSGAANLELGFENPPSANSVGVIWGDGSKGLFANGTDPGVPLLHTYAENVSTEIDVFITDTQEFNLFYCNANNVKDIKIGADATDIKVLDVSNNNIPASEINALLEALDANGVINGTFTSNNQTPAAAPTGAGAAAKTALMGKGWTVTTD